MTTIGVDVTRASSPCGLRFACRGLRVWAFVAVGTGRMPVLRGAHRETPKAGERSTRAMNQTDVMVADETVGPVADPVGIVVGDSLRVRVASVIVLAIVACLAV